MLFPPANTPADIGLARIERALAAERRAAAGGGAGAEDEGGGVGPGRGTGSEGAASASEEASAASAAAAAAASAAAAAPEGAGEAESAAAAAGSKSAAAALGLGKVGEDGSPVAALPADLLPVLKDVLAKLEEAKEEEQAAKVRGNVEWLESMIEAGRPEGESAAEE